LKFLAFESRGYARLGWLQDDGKTILAVNPESRGMPQSMIDVIKRGPYARHQIKNAKDHENFNIDDVQILPPLIPIATFCVAANSSEQAEVDRLKEAANPTIYLRTPRNHIAQGEVIDIPLRTKQLECEGKLVVVMGKGGRYIAKEHALRHIFGYSIYNEGSVKDVQKQNSQFGLGKMFDLTSGFGPHIVTEDELGDPYQQTLETRIDGKLVHSAPLSNLRHSIEETIVYISSGVTMFPGDVICMSIPADEGPMPERIVKKDELVQTTISGVGTLSNPVKAEPTEPRTVGCC
jgi:acylpyruvate hydrolase|tara:strand:+ start:5255 stop:6130 length:876 start_codon:yes stop_codon:yes gene_type:complete